MKRFRALYSLILRTQTTRARVVMLGVLGLLGVVIAIPLRSADDPLRAATHFVDGFGLTPASAVNSNIPNIISDVDASPKVTAFVGSGLFLFAAELS